MKQSKTLRRWELALLLGVACAALLGVWLDGAQAALSDQVIRLLNQRQEPMVFLLWGANAKSKRSLITNPSHLILTAAHPSPYSAYNGFFGCRHFSKCNAFLQQHGGPIDWQIKE